MVGLGRFGRHIAMKLHELHHEVPAVDTDEKRADDGCGDLFRDSQKQFLHYFCKAVLPDGPIVTGNARHSSDKPKQILHKRRNTCFANTLRHYYGSMAASLRTTGYHRYKFLLDYLVLHGAKLIGANSDVSGSIENGIAPACRALVAPIEMATGTQAYFCGKPNPLMMRTGLRMLNCHSGDAVMVGDRMDTDVISGMESGMSTVLVLSGVSTVETPNAYAYRPTIVLECVGDIVKLARSISR